MAMIKLNLDENALSTNNKENYITLKVSPFGTIQVIDGMLYAPAPPGKPGPEGPGYPDGQAFAITIGRKSPFTISDNVLPKRINLAPTVHRIFTATKSNGEGINTRGNITGETGSGDYVLPGDFYRVRNGRSYDYYLVLSTKGGENGVGDTLVKESVYIISVPISEQLCINDE